MMDRYPPAPSAAALAALLPPDVDLEAGYRHEAAAVVWHGVVWGRLGRGDLAWAHLDRVRLPSLWPWIAAERGAILRELGLHAEAENLEFAALVQADDEVDAAMLRVSLTADAVGQGDRDRAERRLAAATDAVGALADTPRAARQRLRLAWVGVEVALLHDRPVAPEHLAALPVWDAVALAPRYPPDHDAGSVFHTAKGLLFGGVARGDRRLLEAAAAVAPPVLAWAVALARADAGVAGAARDARRSWATIVPPPGHAGAVAATPTARRLTGAPG